MAKVSVIIPTYNGSRYICQTIESILSQTYQDWEIIVVDDGSVDATAALLNPYRDRIRYYYQANQGVAAARNFGLAMARGCYINFLDHDDVLLPQKLALQVAVFQEQPQVGMVHSGWRRVNAWAEPLTEIKPWQNIPHLDLHSWLKWMPVLFSAMMFRRQWLDKVGDLDPSLKQACDVDLIQRLALMGCTTVWVKRVTTLYRQHRKNDSLNTLVQAQECWKVRKKFFARTDLPPAIQKQKAQYLYPTLVWMAWRLYYTNHWEEMKAVLLQALNYSPYPYLETVQHWINAFKVQASQHDTELDLEALTHSKEWQQLLYLVHHEASSRQFQT
ncbi:glycosyl transferase family 2 [Halothece sp. PCC 7418]|uniref:glycosyltransferase family 2 protein n=1 Tax=Halothece sp. (strain PCC 7418) TaxID=65093 RepID=UPI0002A07AAC|nr:glycosyltransferase [Halothece sp. PCC 7418]AFZ43440.1 glycosyl transferase family 2 [Halothece sp. PCC 7418]